VKRGEMATIVYSPNRVSSSSNSNQYGSYSSVNKSIHQSQTPQHQQHTMQHGSERLTAVAPPPLSIYQVKEHRNYLTSSHRNYNYKRNKSAVEMLAESKPYYVKSENVLDRHQQLSSRGAGNASLSCEFYSYSLYHYCLPCTANKNMLFFRIHNEEGFILLFFFFAS
jgi:hypothetical protein